MTTCDEAIRSTPILLPIYRVAVGGSKASSLSEAARGIGVGWPQSRVGNQAFLPDPVLLAGVVSKQLVWSGAFAAVCLGVRKWAVACCCVPSMKSNGEMVGL